MPRYRFSDCVLDTARHELTRGGEAVPLSRRAFSALQQLLAAYPDAVSRDAVYAVLWPDTYVNLTNLNNVIAEIRSAIGDHDRTTVVTKHRFGYVVAVPVADDSIVASRFALSIAGRRIVLIEGENLVGRAPEAIVQLDMPSISRHHAMIRVGGDGAEIADLQSKNGTFVGDKRVTAPTPLHDRAVVRFGSIAGVFSTGSAEGTTATDPFASSRERKGDS